MTENLTLSERRYREASGAPHLVNGTTIRCQARSKGKLAAFCAPYEQELRDSGYTEEEVQAEIRKLKEDDNFGWPECQCEKAAAPGAFLCPRFHGGMSKGLIKFDDIRSVMPLDLRAKFDAIYKNPNYFSLHKQIVTLEARNAQIMEQIAIAGGGKDTWEYLEDGLHLIEVNQIADGVKMIRKALVSAKTVTDAWEEIRTNWKLGESMVRTEMSTVEKMRSMATTEQVMNLIDQVHESVLRNVDKHIQEPKVAREFILDFIADLRKLSNASSFQSFESFGEDNTREVYSSE